jgi:hypothetical protein
MRTPIRLSMIKGISSCSWAASLSSVSVVLTRRSGTAYEEVGRGVECLIWNMPGLGFEEIWGERD